MARLTLALKKLICFVFGHDDWLVIKTIIPYFQDDKIRYKAQKFCVRCNRTEDN